MPHLCIPKERQPRGKCRGRNGYSGYVLGVEAAFVLWGLPTPLATKWRSVFERLLDDDERARAAGLVFAPDRDAFIVGHALLRLALSMHTDRTPAESWRFSRPPGGKPRLAGARSEEGPAFSMSDARGIVACCVADEGPVGIDVEELLAAPPDAALVAHACTPSEQAIVREAGPERAALVFTQLWTIKEAVAKAIGAGPDLPLGQISCALDPPRVVALPAGASAATTWQIDMLCPTETTVLTLTQACRADRRKPFSIQHVTDELCMQLLGESP